MHNSDKYNTLISAFKKKAEELMPKGSRIVLYGSRARGDARPDSDWDLLLLIPGPDKLSWALWDEYAIPFADIGLMHDEIVNPRLYSFSGWQKRSFMPFYKNVEHDAITIYQS